MGAYADLVSRHRRMVYKVAQAILGSPDEAEDVVQEVFVRAYRGIGSLNHHQVFAGWVRRIAVNCAVTRIRQRERERRGEKGAGDDPAAAPDPADELVTAELRNWIRRAIRDLPLKQRLAVTLFYLDDMSVAETAQGLGCSASAVKAHLTRARRKLANRMAEHFEEG